MTDPTTSEPKALPPPEQPRKRFGLSTSAVAASALILAVAGGAALGAGGMRLAHKWQPQDVMLLQPSPIAQMRDNTPVAAKGEVTEVFGNKFVLQDASGRLLVDTGPRGENRAAAAKGETITVQGRFDRGTIRAQLVAHADGRAEAFGPPHGPKGPKDGPKGPKGEAKEFGPRADRGSPPPPPADRDDGPPPPPR